MLHTSHQHHVIHSQYETKFSFVLKGTQICHIYRIILLQTLIFKKWLKFLRHMSTVCEPVLSVL